MKLNLALATVALSLLGASANAQLSLVLSIDSTATPVDGGDVVYQGLFTNTSTAPVTVDGSSLTTNVTGFDYFQDPVLSFPLPLTMAPGDSATYDLFELATGGAPYSGIYELTSGANATVVGSAPFSSGTTAVPEPGALALLASGLVGGSLFVARRRK